MSQVTAITMTLSMIFVCSGALPTSMTVTTGPNSMGLAVASDQHDVVLPPLLMLRETVRGGIGFVVVPQQQPQLQIPSQGYANYAMPLVLK